MQKLPWQVNIITVTHSHTAKNDLAMWPAFIELPRQHKYPHLRSRRERAFKTVSLSNFHHCGKCQEQWSCQLQNCPWITSPSWLHLSWFNCLLPVGQPFFN